MSEVVLKEESNKCVPILNSKVVAKYSTYFVWDLDLKNEVIFTTIHLQLRKM